MNIYLKVISNFLYCFCSGRTSRREIRKLLSECLFWRFKRVKHSRQGSNQNTHPFYFDEDDDDIERSAGTTGGASYCPLGIHPQHRLTYLSQQSSSNNYPMKPSKKSFFTCCGFTIDLSHKHSTNSVNGDLTPHRSTMRKSSINTASNNTTNYTSSPRKSRTYSHSSKSSSFDRNIRQQQTVCYKSNSDNNRIANRRRASAAVHCFQHSPSSTVATMANQSLRLSANLPLNHQTISKENAYSSIEILPPSNISDATPTTIDVYNNNITSQKDLQESALLVQNNIEEPPLPAYIVETC